MLFRSGNAHEAVSQDLSNGDPVEIKRCLFVRTEAQETQIQEAPELCSTGLQMQETDQGFSGGTVVKNLPANAGDLGSIPGSGRFLGGGHGNPLQYSCLENPMDRGSGRLQSMECTKSQT